MVSLAVQRIAAVPQNDEWIRATRSRLYGVRNAGLRPWGDPCGWHARPRYEAFATEMFQASLRRLQARRRHLWPLFLV